MIVFISPFIRSIPSANIRDFWFSLSWDNDEENHRFWQCGTSSVVMGNYERTGGVVPFLVGDISFKKSFLSFIAILFHLSFKSSNEQLFSNCSYISDIAGFM